MKAKVSFVMSGDSLKTHQYKALVKKIASMNNGKTSAADIVLYFSERLPGFSASFISLVYSNSGAGALKNAVIAASGDKLVFTTVRNLLEDHKSEMLNLAIAAPVDKIGVPFRKTTVGRILGIRGLRDVYYVIANRSYAVETAPKFKNLRRLVIDADRQFGLLKTEPLNTKLPERLIRSRLFLRPYRAIFASYFHKLLGDKKSKPTTSAKEHEPQTLGVKYSPKIPVFIICRDRLKPLKQLVKWCEDEGLKNIIFIDNASSYKPLLEYYSSTPTPYDVIMLASNVGKVSPWQTGAVNVLAHDSPYIVSDSDIIPSPEAHGAVKLFSRLLNDYPERIKVGFGLVIDDIPDSYELKDYVVSWEKQFWQKEVEKDVYDADIDTTFALHRQNAPYYIGHSLRTGGRFVARHETWYIDSKHPSKEALNYRGKANKEIGTWGLDSKDLSKTYRDHRRDTKRANPSR